MHLHQLHAGRPPVRPLDRQTNRAPANFVHFCFERSRIISSHVRSLLASQSVLPWLRPGSGACGNDQCDDWVGCVLVGASSCSHDAPLNFWVVSLPWWTMVGGHVDGGNDGDDDDDSSGAGASSPITHSSHSYQQCSSPQSIIDRADVVPFCSSGLQSMAMATTSLTVSDNQQQCCEQTKQSTQ